MQESQAAAAVACASTSTSTGKCTHYCTVQIHTHAEYAVVEVRTGERHDGGRERVEREREHASVAEVLLQVLDARHLVLEARLLHTHTCLLQLERRTSTSTV